MPAIKPVVIGLLILGAGAGCTVGPNYRPPSPAVPSQYSGAAPAGQSLERWWTVFGDPELQALVERGLRNNRDLQTALSRVRVAREQRTIAAAGLIPNLDATSGYNRSLGSKNVVLPLGALGGGSSSSSGSSGSSSSTSRTSSTTGRAVSPELATASGGGGTDSAAAGTGTGQPGGPASPFGEGGLPGVTTNLYQAGFDAVWEIDVFGGTRRQIEAAAAEAGAAEEAARAARVSLIAEIAENYFQMRAAQIRVAIARRNVQSQQSTLRIAEDKFKAEVGDEGNVARLTAQLRTIEAGIPPLQTQEATSRHQIEYLVGEFPDALRSELETPLELQPLPPTLPAGVPSDLLRRRPDIRQAERELASATAEVGVATAQLFPQFSLTGSAGLDSSELKSLPDWSSRYYSIAPGIRWPILEWGRLHAQVRVENELQQQSLLAYQNTVAQALQDVEDALVRYRAELERHAALASAVQQSQRAQALEKQTYASGLADQLATLDADRTVYQSQDALAQSDAALRTDLVSLYKALGGGWEVN
jgi:NodT family efflux transporter outer membrane factor (OMF) lipoprotein